MSGLGGMPGWDSIGDSGWWSSFWFCVSFVCLFALGASQIVSHAYRLRYQELAVADHRIADRRWRGEVGLSERRRAAEVSALHDRLAAAKAEIERLQAHAGDRHVSAAQRDRINDALKAMPGIAVSFVLLEDEEAATFGEELVSAFQGAGVAVVGVSRRNVLLPAPVGVRAWLRDSDTQSAAILDAFESAQIPVTPINGRLEQAAHIVVGVRFGQRDSKQPR
jgi:hypothetical protein